MTMQTSYVFRYKSGDDLPPPSRDLTTDAESFDRVTLELRGLFRERNNVYRSRFREYGLAAVMSWIGAKVHSAASLLVDGPSRAADEDLTETLLDLAVYAVLGAMLTNEQADDGTPCRHLFGVSDGPVTPLRESAEHVRCVLCGRAARLAPNREPVRTAGS